MWRVWTELQWNQLQSNMKNHFLNLLNSKRKEKDTKVKVVHADDDAARPPTPTMTAKYRVHLPES